MLTRTLQGSSAHWIMSLDGQAAVDDAIAARDREIARIEEVKRLLRNHRNALSPINNRLPPELLSEIFLSCFHATLDSFVVWPYRWISATHVCQHWRDIALRTPRLWSHIILTRSDNILGRSSRMREWIKRSGRLPLKIEQLEVFMEVQKISYTVGSEVLSLIMQEAHRAQQLSVTLGGPTIHSSLDGNRTLSSPILDTVTVIQTSEVAPASLKLVRDSVWPSLASLKCIDVSTGLLQAFMRNTLTTLNVKCCKPPLAVAEWLPILGEMVSLVRLTLIHAVRSSEEPLGTRTVVRLPALQYLWIQDRNSGIDSAALLSRLAIPSKVRAHVAGDGPVSEAQAKCILADVASKAAGKGIIGEPWIARVCIADYLHERRQVTLILYPSNRPLHLDAGADADANMRDRQAGFSVTLTLDRDSLLREPIIRTFYSLISVSDVEGIIFGGHINQAETLELLMRPRRVCQLEAYTHFSTGIRLLRRLQVDSMSDDDTVSFPCPALSRLTLHIVAWTRRRSAPGADRRARAFIRLLADTFEKRAKHGLRLTHLTLTCTPYEDTAGCEHDFVRLRALVEHFSPDTSVQDRGDECEGCVDSEEEDEMWEEGEGG